MSQRDVRFDKDDAWRFIGGVDALIVAAGEQFGMDLGNLGGTAPPGSCDANEIPIVRKQSTESRCVMGVPDIDKSGDGCRNRFVGGRGIRPG